MDTQNGLKKQLRELYNCVINMGKIYQKRYHH